MPIGNPTPTSLPAGTTTVSVPVTANYSRTAYSKVITCRSTELSTLAPTHTINQVAAVLNLSLTTLNPAASGGTYSITVTSDWPVTISSNQSWLRPNVTSLTGSGSFNIIVDVNTVVSQRTGVINVSNGTISSQVTVIQAAAAEILTINPTTQSVVVGGAMHFTSVTSNIGWIATSNVSWVTIQGASSGIGNGTVSYSVAANASTSTRSGVITVSGGSITRTLTITQAAFVPSLNITPTSFTIPRAGSEDPVITVSSNTSWTASSNASWLTIRSGNSGTGAGNIFLTVSENTTTQSRSAAITVTGGGITRTCAISQEGEVFSISPTTQAVSGSGGMHYATITSNAPWVVDSYPNWITIQGASSGTGNATLTYSVSSNTGAARNGTITVRTASGSISRTLTINQAIADFYFSNTPRTVVAAGIPVSTPGVASLVAPGLSWTAYSSQSWLTVMPNSVEGTGSTSVLFYVAANTGAARTAYIRATSGSRTTDFVVNQEAGQVTPPPTGLEISPMSITVNGGQEFALSVTSNSNWTATISGAIRSANPSSGTPAINTIRVIPNGALNEYQYGFVDIRNENGDTASCSVTIRDMNA